MTESARIASLETQVRTLKRMFFGVFGLVVVGSVLGATSLQTVPDVIRANKFEVVSDSGKIRAILDSKFRMFNDEGHRVLYAYESSSGSGVLKTERKGGGYSTMSAQGFRLQNKFDRSIVRLGPDTSDRGMLEIADSSGSREILLSNTLYGGDIKTYANGKPTAVLSSTSSGGIIVASDTLGRSVFSASSQASGGSIELLNNKNKPIVGMGSDEKGVGFIMTQDGNSGDPVVVLTRESLGSDGKIVLNKKYGYNTVLE